MNQVVCILAWKAATHWPENGRLLALMWPVIGPIRPPVGLKTAA